MQTKSSAALANLWQYPAHFSRIFSSSAWSSERGSVAWLKLRGEQMMSKIAKIKKTDMHALFIGFYFIGIVTLMLFSYQLIS